MKTLSFAKTSSIFKRITVLHLLKGISCNHDYSAFKKYMVYRGLCWNRERENDPRKDGPGGLADTLNQSTKLNQHAVFSTQAIVEILPQTT